MTEKIKSMFSKMNDQTREEALKSLMLEFNLESPKFIKKNWIIGGRIPEKNQKRILQLFHGLLAAQVIAIHEMEVIF